MNGNETYKAIAEALPYELQSALLSIREVQNNDEGTRKLFYKMPAAVYIALIELCLIKPWDEVRKTGLEFTSAGAHLVNYCSC